MSYLTDPDFDKKMSNLVDFLTEEQAKLSQILNEINEEPDEFDPQSIFGDE